MGAARWRRRAERAGFALAAAGVAGFCLFPFYWALVTSLETGTALYQVTYWPQQPTLANYAAIFTGQAFGRNLLNSALVATATVAASLLLAAFAAYSLSRVRFRGRVPLLLTVLGVSMFPQVAVLSGLFELVNALGLYNRWPGLALAYLIFTLPFSVWVLTMFMQGLPPELEESALVDGASPAGVVWRIFLPLVSPALVTTGLLAFVLAWNEFLFALTLTLTDRSRTVPVAIALISGASEHELPWGRVMAASVVVTLPLVLLVLAFQRRIATGLMLGGVKG